MSVSTQVQQFMEVLETTTAEAMKANSEGVRASAELALLMQKMATQQVVLGSYLEQRAQIVDLVDSSSGPMVAMLEAQLSALDAKAVGIMHEAGVPKKTAQEALATFSRVHTLDSNPINTLRINGRIPAA